MHRKRISAAIVSLCLGIYLLWPARVVENASSGANPTFATTPSVAQPLLPKVELRYWLSVVAGKTNFSSDELAQGRQAALQRRETMSHLMRDNPAQALAQSLYFSEWLSLPADLRPLVERPFSEVVDFQVLPSCPPREGVEEYHIHPHRITIGDEVFEGFLLGAKAKITSKESLPARGIMLDRTVVLAEGSFQRLDGPDLAAAEQIFPRGHTAGVSWTSGQPIGAKGRTILFGGVLYDLASDDEESALADALLTAERSFHPKAMVMAFSAGTAAAGTIAFSVDDAKKQALVANSTWTETPKTVLAVRLSYSSAPTTYSYTLTEFTNILNQASNTVKTFSYGKTWLIPRVVTVNLPNPQTYYEQPGNGPDAIVNDTRTRLTAMGINRDSYNIVIHSHPGAGGPNFGYAGLAVIGGANQWLNGKVDLGVVVHELGHNYGLGHAHSWTSHTGMGSLGRTGNDGEQVEFEEYGDIFDVMGGGPLPAAHYGAHGKFALNWIETKEVINVVTNGIYRLYRFDHIGARTNSNAKLALKVTAPGGEEYWISHRRLFSAIPTTARGAYIVRADGGGDQSVVDTAPLSATTLRADKDDSGLAIGKSFVDSVGSVRLTTIAAGGVAPLEYIDVQVAFTPDTGSYSFFADAAFKTNGLVGSYVNANLRTRTAQTDWRSTTGITISGRRIDERLSFTSDGWGQRSPLRLTGGTDANWDNFSVQWDGWIVVRRPIRLATTSDDSSRFWIDLNGSASFASLPPEYINNHWGTGQGPTRGDLSAIIPPGSYRIRIQYEEGNGGNYFTMNGTELPFQLFTTAARAQAGLTASFVAQSLRAITTQTDWRTTQAIAGSRIDEYPVFKDNGWGSLTSVGLDGNGTDDNWENFSVQWDGFITNSVPLKLATISDDDSRLWIDVNGNGTFSTIAPEYNNNNWGGAGQGSTIGAITATLQPGMYAIRIQYEDGNGDNSFVLAGAPQFPVEPGTTFTSIAFSGTTRSATPRRVAGDFTIEFWLRTTQVDGSDENLCNGATLAEASLAPGSRDFGVTLGNGKVLFGVGGASDTTVRSHFIADGTWHHIAARRTQSSGEISLFVDGAEIETAVGSTDLLDAATDILSGSAADGSRGFTGTMEQLRIWDSSRSDQQILADLHVTRGTRWPDVGPILQLAQLQPNSVQLYWDALSSYRILEGATTVTGPYTPLFTDQNSTNIPMGANSMRYFRVRK